jgi:hypothetical protein
MPPNLTPSHYPSGVLVPPNPASNRTFDPGYVSYPSRTWPGGRGGIFSINGGDQRILRYGQPVNPAIFVTPVPHPAMPTNVPQGGVTPANVPPVVTPANTTNVGIRCFFHLQPTPGNDIVGDIIGFFGGPSLPDYTLLSPCIPASGTTCDLTQPPRLPWTIDNDGDRVMVNGISFWDGNPYGSGWICTPDDGTISGGSSEKNLLNNHIGPG